mmetsp:Transcript_975/g.3610  ORF Transcript_975/g.3610 Transcript_975/m.3610 type:complete len:240 (+) Transcript_975:1438-2157(+)
MSLGASKAIASKSFVCGLPRIQYAQMRFAMSCSLKKRRFLSATSAAASSRASAGTRSVAKAQTRFTRFCALKDPSATALPSGASKTILATWSKSLTALSRPSGSWSHQSDLAKAQTKFAMFCDVASPTCLGAAVAMAENSGASAFASTLATLTLKRATPQATFARPCGPQSFPPEMLSVARLTRSSRGCESVIEEPIVAPIRWNDVAKFCASNDSPFALNKFSTSAPSAHSMIHLFIWI